MQSLDEQVGCFTEFKDSSLSGCRQSYGEGVGKKIVRLYSSTVRK